MSRRLGWGIVIIILAILIFGGALARFYTDWLWFGEVGYRSVFWKAFTSKLELGLIAGILFFLAVYSNLWLARRLAPPIPGRYDESELRARIGRIARRGLGFLIFILTVAASILVGLEARSHWLGYQMFTHPTPFPSADPIFHKNIGFYIFRLGFLQYIYGWLFFTVVVAMIATAVVHYIDRAIEVLARIPTFAPHVKAHLSLLLAAALFVKAWGYRLAAYNLLYTQSNFMYGAGYADVHARLLALKVLSVVAVLAGILALINIYRRGIGLPAAALLILIGTSLVMGGIYPAFVEQVYVKPNQIELETPYMRHNIKFTRDAFNLGKIEEKDFPALTSLTAQDIENNHATINSIRLWDYRPIQSTYSQLQALWQYYEIPNVDYDRYTINSEIRQVTLAARELSPGVARRAGTWVNQHFQYTHGYGAVMSPVNRMTSEGLPEFFVEDIPPTSTVGIDITRPQIYYGSVIAPNPRTDYVVVNSQTQEFDYPSEPEPAYTRYAGKGGVSVGSYLKRLAFAWRFGDVNLMLKNPITAKSRLMFRRQIDERIQTIFPFVYYDPDPYLVISEGKLYWMWDAYTISRRYPYSQPYPISETTEVNYIRNSLKIVIDAYSGTVDYYVADPADPIIRTYGKIFPGVFKPLDRMPAGLKAHIRYPELLFTTQTDVLRVYHMQQPEVFYIRGDLWDVPNEIVGTESQEQPIEAYYVVMKLPEETNETFLLMRPFTPHNKPNMVAWMAAKCGPEDYGKIILYEFPKNKLVYGPAQIESRINQDSTISPQLTLWDTAGSRVNRGNLLVIPIEKSIIYVKPLYLQSESSKIPELKRVVVAYSDQVAMEETLEGALARVFGGRAAPTPGLPPPTAQTPGQAPTSDVQKLASQAAQELQRAEELQRQGDWAGYGEQLDKLQQTLKQLQQASQRR